MKYKEEMQEYCFNNIVFAAQMYHKNAPKLIGCCLETETPISVFEYMKYGTLADHIFCGGQSDFEPLLWTRRLKIAMEIADVVANLHFGFPRPIVFRDIKPTNILFNEENVSKLFDFSLCISIPEDKNYIMEDKIVGSFGYMAPEYVRSGYCDEKCDVFSFGILLLVLLTGKAPHDLAFSSLTEEDLSPRDCVLEHIENSKFEEIVDPVMIGDELSVENKQQLRSFADLAIRCTSEFSRCRPTMVHVAKDIRKIYLLSNSD